MNRFSPLSSHPRTAVLVDCHNLYFSARNLFHSKVNYTKLLPLLAAPNREIVSATAYVICKPNTDIASFETVLYKSGFDVQLRETIERARTSPSGSNYTVNLASWEIGMALDMQNLAPKVDTIILVCGNGVMTDAVIEASRYCRVEIAGFGQHTSLELKDAAADFIDLSAYKELLLPDIETEAAACS